MLKLAVQVRYYAAISTLKNQISGFYILSRCRTLNCFNGTKGKSNNWSSRILTVLQTPSILRLLGESTLGSQRVSVSARVCIRISHHRESVNQGLMDEHNAPEADGYALSWGIGEP